MRNHRPMAESGELIRDFRRSRKPKMPQSELATAVGITKASLSRIESGKLALSLDLAKKLSAETGIPMRALLPDLAAMFNEPRQTETAQ